MTHGTVHPGFVEGVPLSAGGSGHQLTHDAAPIEQSTANAKVTDGVASNAEEMGDQAQQLSP